MLDRDPNVWRHRCAQCYSNTWLHRRAQRYSNAWRHRRAQRCPNAWRHRRAQRYPNTWRHGRAQRSDSPSTVWPLLALATLITTLAAACAAGEESRFVVNEENGVRVAENFGPDRPHPATPVRLATLQPPDGALTAVPWGVVADPEGRRIFVADATSERVVVFDADGTFLRTLGRAGDGPGEFRSPTALALDEDGAAAVWDARRGIISRWSTEGELLDERRAPLNYWGPGFAMRGDDVVTVTMSTTGNVQRQSLVRSTDSGEPTEIAAVSRELVPLELPGMSMPAPRIFAPDLIWTSAGDEVLVLNGPEYRIDIYADGRLVGSVRRDQEPIVVTGELAAARVGSGPYRGFMRRTGLTAERMVAAIGYEELASPIEWIAVAPTGELWVSRGHGPPRPRPRRRLRPRRSLPGHPRRPRLPRRLPLGFGLRRPRNDRVRRAGAGALWARA